MVRIYLRVGNVFTARSRGTDFQIEVTVDPFDSNWEIDTFFNRSERILDIEQIAVRHLTERFPSRAARMGCIRSRLGFERFGPF